jgi:hypothetical protein
VRYGAQRKNCSTDLYKGENVMKSTIGLAALFLMVALHLAHAADAVSPRTVTFVCEHGVAKSVIAAAHFNRLAAAANLNYRAVARRLAERWPRYQWFYPDGNKS